jgi:acetolactate synthase regulatory subunit
VSRWGGRRLRRARLLRIRRNRGKRSWSLLKRELRRTLHAHIDMVVTEARALGREDLAQLWDAKRGRP